MVNSKKISKQSIAIIALSVLLVLSMIISLSGAWFSDAKTSPDVTTIGFGTVVVGEVNATGIALVADDPSGTLAMPGDTVNVDFTAVNGGTAQVWMRYKVTFDVSSLGDDAAELEAALSTYAVYNYVTDPVLAGATASVEGSVTLPTVLTNALQGASIPVSLTVEFIQWANNHASDCAGAFSNAGYTDTAVPAVA